MGVQGAIVCVMLHFRIFYNRAELGDNQGWIKPLRLVYVNIRCCSVGGSSWREWFRANGLIAAQLSVQGWGSEFRQTGRGVWTPKPAYLPSIVEHDSQNIHTLCVGKKQPYEKHLTSRRHHRKTCTYVSRFTDNMLGASANKHRMLYRIYACM